MKTIKKGKKIVRASDGVAQEMVEAKGWKYCPKSKWREKVRDAEKPTERKFKKNIKKRA